MTSSLGDVEVLDERFRTTGVIVMGRRMFDVGERPWGENRPFHVPVFVLTHETRARLVKQGGATLTFVTDGIECALEQARVAGVRVSSSPRTRPTCDFAS